MRRYSLLSCALVMLMLSGCASFNDMLFYNKDNVDKELPKHLLSIDRDGRLKPTGGNIDSIIDGIKKFAEQQRHNQKEAELLLFVHGGLNTEVGALKRANETYLKIFEDSQHPKYPVFVLWESDGLETYMDHLTRIRQGKESPTAGLTFPVYFLTDLGNSIINAPKSWLITGEEALKPIRKKDKDLLDEFKKLPSRFNNISYTGTKEQEYQSSLVRKLRWLLASPSKAVTTPFAYTMPRSAWDVMLRRTNTLFYTPEDLDLLSKDKVYEKLAKREPGSGALYALLEELKDELPNIKITLVGHSMGAIIVNKIILLEPELPYKNIVHLASADSINNLFNMVIPYIDYDIQKKEHACNMEKKLIAYECKEQAKEQAVHFYSLMLHPDNEDREEAWGGLVPSGSLLTWIDNMYTSPETVLDRRSGRWDNVKNSIKFIPTSVAENMHFKIFGINRDGCKDECTTPQKHGDFDNMPFWDEATWK